MHRPEINRRRAALILMFAALIGAVVLGHPLVRFRAPAPSNDDFSNATIIDQYTAASNATIVVDTTYSLMVSGFTGDIGTFTFQLGAPNRRAGQITSQ